MPKAQSPRGARPRQDIRPRVLAALTSEPSTATEIAERAGIPVRERGMHAAHALVRLEADGPTVRRTLAHRKSHRGCPLQPDRYSGTPSPHPQALT